jgi:hypothetical protein
MEAAAPCEEGGGLHAWASSLKDRRVRRGGRPAGFVHMRRKPRGRASPHSWPHQDKVGVRMSGGEPHASVSCDVDSGDRDPCRRSCCAAALGRRAHHRARQSSECPGACSSNSVQMHASRGNALPLPLCARCERLRNCSADACSGRRAAVGEGVRKTPGFTAKAIVGA